MDGTCNAKQGEMAQKKGKKKEGVTYQDQKTLDLGPSRISCLDIGMLQDAGHLFFPHSESFSLSVICSLVASIKKSQKCSEMGLDN